MAHDPVPRHDCLRGALKWLLMRSCQQEVAHDTEGHAEVE
jgi:hypothetical protein